MSNSPGPLDIGNRFSGVDDDHHGGILWITASLSMTYFVLSCILRIYLGYRQLAKDTVSLVAATSFGFLQVVLVYAQLGSGFGTSIDLLDAGSIIAMQKKGYVADILLIIAMALSKVSVVFFLARLSPDVKYLRFCTGVSVLCIAWGTAGVFSLALRCDLSQPWIFIGVQCTNLLLRWQLIAAFDIITESIILSLIIGLVFNLQMHVEKKVVVVLGFAFRLPLIVLAILHVHYVRSYIGSTNATFDQITPSTMKVVQLGWSLISATIPCLRSFVANLGSGYLGATLITNPATYANSRDGSTLPEGTFVLNKISVSRPQETTVTGGRERQPTVQPDAVSIRSANRVSNDGSQEFIIRRTVDYQIHYEDTSSTLH